MGHGCPQVFMPEQGSLAQRRDGPNTSARKTQQHQPIKSGLLQTCPMVSLEEGTWRCVRAGGLYQHRTSIPLCWGDSPETVLPHLPCDRGPKEEKY